MKNLKSVLFATAFGIANLTLAQQNAISNSVQPQSEVAQTKDEAVKERATYNERATKQTARINEICDLNDDQKIKVYQIYLDSYPQIKAAKKEAGTDTAKANEATSKIEKERRAKVEATLTPNQKSRLDAAVKANNGKPVDSTETTTK